MKDSYDVAVIGAGIGGLTAGALLAKRGLSVAVFEKESKPGGYCASFRRKGYTFDACLDAISGCGPGGWLKRVLEKLGVEGRVELVRLDPLRVDDFAGERLAIPASLPELMELLYGLASSERDGITGLFRAMEEIYRTAMVTPPEVLYNDPRLDRREGALPRYRHLTYKALLGDFVQDLRVRAVLSDRCAFMGLPPSKVSAVATATMFMTFGQGGGYRIKDGARRLAEAIAQGLLDSGGEVYYRNPVTGIRAEGGRVSGVETADGFVGAKAVVSAIDAARTAELAGMEMSPRVLKPSVSFFMVYLGLNRDLGLPDSIGLYPGYDIEGTFLDIDKDIVSAKSSMEMINYSRISPGMAPEGHSSVMLMAKAAYRYREEWHDCKARETERMIDRADSSWPGIRGCVEYAEAATPMTLERYTGNSSGAAFGFEQSAGNPRPAAQCELPGLYLAGHWTYPGGGIESVAASGIVASGKVASWLDKE